MECGCFDLNWMSHWYHKACHMASQSWEHMPGYSCRTSTSKVAACRGQIVYPENLARLNSGCRLRVSPSRVCCVRRVVVRGPPGSLPGARFPAAAPLVFHHCRVPLARRPSPMAWFCIWYFIWFLLSSFSFTRWRHPMQRITASLIFKLTQFQ